MGLKALKEILDTPEYVGECTLAGKKGIGRLTNQAVSVVERSGIKKILTERRTPIPVKITAAGGYTCISTNIKS